MSFLDELPKPFFALAPLDDVSDTVFRQIVAECAKPDIMFTEFVNVDGLQSAGREHLLHKLKLTDKEKPVIAQLWGLKPENFYKTTKELAGMGFAGVDLNMGCPVKAVVKNGACAALINNRELAGEIIDATKAAAGASLPVSVKTRVGYTTVDMDWIEFLLSKILNMLSILSARLCSCVIPCHLQP
jgi:tRNA-dihydrouridine synthase